MHTLRNIRAFRAAALVVVAGFTLAGGAEAQRIPDRLADSTFWRMTNDYSEPWGVFRSENFVSNETSLQWIIPELQRIVKPGGVYLGVAPDQNFTYILAVQPSIAFIVDIRHQNAVQHLMYKALFEMSGSRAEFLAKLFARPRLGGVDTASSIVALFDAVANSKPDSSTYRANLQAIKDRLTKDHHFALSDSEVVSLNCVYGAFFTYGPALTYGHSSDCRNPGPFTFGRGGRGGGGGITMGGGGYGMPSYLSMMLETDGTSMNRSYLATEANFRAIKSMEERNLIVPLTGNFAGDKAVRAAGQYARDHGAVVTTFYLSNVEQYLFQQDDEAQRFYRNVATLPIDSTSTFIRSFVGGMYGAPPIDLKQQSGRSKQGIASMQEQLKQFDAGELTSWMEVIRRSRQ
ncbi:MAG: hypothetical protein ABJE10_19030 [bacterium]